MFRRVVVLLGIFGAVGAAARAVVPDIRRYLKLRRM